MRGVVGLSVAVAVLVASLRVASGQVVPTDSTPTPSRDTPGAKIPITMSGGTEVLGAESSGSTAATPTLVDAPPISLEQPVDPDQYICGSGDVFELNFWGQQNFRLKIGANLEGKAFISKVGFVAVAGKTLSAVRKEVHRKVGANYPGLNFELSLVKPRSFIVHIVDFVKEPGSYPANPLERLSVVLERAGGITAITGSRRRITIKHRNGQVTTADLLQYELTGDTAFNPFILDGDIVDVPHAEITVKVTGAVRRPGTYELVGTKDVTELLSLTGGLAGNAAYSLPIRLVRRDDQQRASFRELPFSGTTPQNLALRDDDEVEVRKTDELQRTVLIIGAVVGADSLDLATTSKRLAFIEGDTVLTLLTRAGGISAPGDLRRSYITRSVKGGPAQHIPIDLEALLVNRDFTADQKIEIDDTIVVPPMQYSVLVEGAVARGGMYPFNPQFGILEYIAHAGGRSRTATNIDDVKLIDWNGVTHKYRKDLRPSPGDSILVPERNFTRAEVVQIVIAGASLVISAAAIGIAASR